MKDGVDAEPRIAEVVGREIRDSRGLPTVQVDVRLTSGVVSRADAPAGLSKGEREAVDLRDGEQTDGGLGVRKAVANVDETIAGALRGQRADRQGSIDAILVELDGTPRKERLGTNATTATSLAVCRAAAAHYGLPVYRYLNADAHVLPVPQLDLINGGAHAAGGADIQEFMVMPTGAENMAEAVRCGTQINAHLGSILAARYPESGRTVGEGGGYAPQVADPREMLDVLHEAAAEAGCADRVEYALDCAAGELYDEARDAYRMAGEWLSTIELMALYRGLVDDYGVISIEDPFHPEDWEAYAAATRQLGIQIVGDDLFATNAAYVAEGIARGAANALLIKVNQVSTLSEALDAANLALQNGYRLVVSERSGDTEDPSDLAVALNAGQIKTGAPVGAVRTAKYDRLVDIADDLGDAALYGQVR